MDWKTGWRRCNFDTSDLLNETSQSCHNKELRSVLFKRTPQLRGQVGSNKCDCLSVATLKQPYFRGPTRSKCHSPQVVPLKKPAIAAVLSKEGWSSPAHLVPEREPAVGADRRQCAVDRVERDVVDREDVLKTKPFSPYIALISVFASQMALLGF